MKIMFHYINKKKFTSPTIVNERIKDLIKNDNFCFCDLDQTTSANGFINFKLIRNLASKINYEKPDVVVLTGIASAFHAAIACKICKIKKIIIITHGIDSLNLDRTWIKRKLFKYIIEPLTILLATDIQCNSKFVYNMRMMKLFGRNKRHIIYNPLPANMEKYKKINIYKNKFVVLSASRIIKSKGYDILAEAINKIDDNNIMFIIAGDGEYIETLKSNLSKKKNVKFTGNLENQEILQLMANCDLFVLPSKLYETYGLVYTEAALMYTPSISGNRGAVSEIVNNDNGYILQKYDSEELANLILYAFNHKEINKNKGIIAYKSVTSLNSNSKIREKIIALYGGKNGKK